MRGVGQIGFFSWLLATLVFNFLLASIPVQKTCDLYSKNEHSLGKERVIRCTGRAVMRPEGIKSNILVPRCLFHWYMLNFSLDLPLA